MRNSIMVYDIAMSAQRTMCMIILDLNLFVNHEQLSSLPEMSLGTIASAS